MTVIVKIAAFQNAKRSTADIVAQNRFFFFVGNELRIEIEFLRP